MKSFVISILFVAFSASLIAQEQGIPYTLADRDRLIKVEEQMSSLNQRMDDMNNRIDDMNNRIDRLEDKFDSYFTWGFGLVLGAIFYVDGLRYLGSPYNTCSRPTATAKNVGGFERVWQR